jgi:hypothetical protein
MKQVFSFHFPRVVSQRQKKWIFRKRFTLAVISVMIPILALLWGFSGTSLPAAAVMVYYVDQSGGKDKGMTFIDQGRPLIRLPEGAGLAARYPGDQGIAGDKAVLFVENFEDFKGEQINTSEMGGWDNFYGNLVITRETVNVNHGKQSLQVTHTTAPKAHGAVKEVAGYDTLFVRFYMKFHEKFPGCHHAGMYIRGGQPGALRDNPTGTRPTGADHFNAALDHLFPTHSASPPENKTPPGWTYNYCYHMDQVDRYGDILLSSGTNNGSDLLGPQFIPRPNKVPLRDRWYCFELMIQCNTPGSRNGRVGIWIDGQLVADHPNLRFREVESLKARYVTLSTYTSWVEPNQVLWYDDIVVATKYIGPIEGKNKN